MTDYTKMCPKYEQAAMLLGKKWTSLILRMLLGGPKRFVEFGTQVPELTDRVLSERLKELCRAGVVHRQELSDPVGVEYSLTDQGQDLAPVVESIQQWADRWVDKADCDC